MKTKFNFKSFFTLLVVTLSMLFTVSCNDSTKTEEKKVVEKEWNAEKKGEVVYVNNGTESFFMNYLLYSTLMNSGGYNNVYHHYQTHPDISHSQNTLKNQYSSIKSEPIRLKSEVTKHSISSPSKTKNIINSSHSLSNTNNLAVKTKTTTYKPSMTVTRSYKSPSYKSSSSSSYKSSYRPSYSSSRSSWSSSRSFSRSYSRR